MANVFIDKRALRSTFQRQKGVFKSATDAYMIPSLDQLKEDLLEDIHNDPTSKEIMQKNELFGFIGFDAKGDTGLDQNDPVEDLIRKVEETTIVPAGSYSVNFTSEKTANVKYRITVTDRNDIEDDDQLQLPWMDGKSWVYAIEDGLNNFSNFLIGDRPSSRSGAGIQAKHSTGRGNFIPRPYFTSIIKNWIKKVNLLSTYKSKRYNIRDILGRFFRL